MSIGRIIKTLRRNKGLSQAKLASLVGICRSSLGYYERDVIVPRIEILERISKVLNVPLKEFFISSNKRTYKEQEVVFMSLLREDNELYNKVMNNPENEIKKWKRYSKIDSKFIR